MSTEIKRKWYKTWWGILIIILLFPVFIMVFLTRLIWKQKWKMPIRIAAIAFLWGVVYIAGAIPNNKTQSVVANDELSDISEPTPSQSLEEELEETKKKVYVHLTETEKMLTSPTTKPTLSNRELNFIVASQIVKRVNGKYRYFFDIRNKDTEPFKGSVTISLYTDDLKNPIAGDTFTTSKAIAPGLGDSVYTDAFTGPPSAHGANGISKFKYIVKVGEAVVNTGEGIITKKFEEVDAY